MKFVSHPIGCVLSDNQRFESFDLLLFNQFVDRFLAVINKLRDTLYKLTPYRSKSPVLYNSKFDIRIEENFAN